MTSEPKKSPSAQGQAPADRVKTSRKKAPKSHREPTDSGGGLGCGFFLFACVSACTLLLLNVAFVGALFEYYAPVANFFSQNIRLKQAGLLIFPIVLVVMEYWLFDIIVDRLSLTRAESDEARTS